jgi:4'-phosphopantetheinyl transferase
MQPPPERFTIEPLDGPPRWPDERVQIFAIDLAGSPASPDLFDLLNVDEKIRAERYRAVQARERFVVARGQLRRRLGLLLDLPPREVPISYTGAGKPVLAGRLGTLHFNVSHTDGLALLALARRPVGVDIERLRALADAEGMVARFFSARECDAFRRLPPELRPAGFFRGWTCKEAVIKAGAFGVSILDAFDVELHPGKPAALLGSRHAAIDATGWRLTAWEPKPGYAAALAESSPA